MIAEKRELFFFISSFVSAACHVAHQQGTQQNNWHNLQSTETAWSKSCNAGCWAKKHSMFCLSVSAACR